MNILGELKKCVIDYLYKRYLVDKDLTKEPRPSFNVFDDILFIIWEKLNNKWIKKINKKRKLILGKLTPHREDEFWVLYDTAGIPEFMGENRTYVCEPIK